MESKGLIDELTSNRQTRILILTSRGTYIGKVDKEEKNNSK